MFWEVGAEKFQVDPLHKLWPNYKVSEFILESFRYLVVTTNVIRNLYWNGGVCIQIENKIVMSTPKWKEEYSSFSPDLFNLYSVLSELYWFIISEHDLDSIRYKDDTVLKTGRIYC